MKKHYAVVGMPINHSLSPLIHQQFAKQQGITLTYQKLQVNEDDFAAILYGFFDQKGLGLNITSPYKELAYQFAQIRTPRCQQAKAANTLWVQDGLIHGDNTDGVGLTRDLARCITLNTARVLLLGAGGAARGIIAPLLAEGISELTIFNRTAARANALREEYPQLIYCSSIEASRNYDLIINATSASLSGENFLLPISLLTQATYCYDLVYDVKQLTPFTQWASQHGCAASDGLGMLVEQAAAAFYIWHGVMPDTTAVMSRLRSVVMD